MIAGHKDNEPDGQTAPIPELSHALPLRVLLSSWIALMLLTILTVAVVYVDLGRWNIWIALGIATIKAVVVALFFMHLLYDRPFNAVVFLSSLFFAGLFIGIVLMDSKQYQPEIERRRQQERNAGQRSGAAPPILSNALVSLGVGCTDANSTGKAEPGSRVMELFA